MSNEKLRDEAKRALGRKEIEYLIGYRQGSYGFRISAAFITNKEDADLLTFSPLCALSLVNYLTIEGKPPLTPAEQKAKPGKIALVVRGCDSRALNQILAEGGLSRDRLYIIGVACTGAVGSSPAASAATLGRQLVTERLSAARSHDRERIVFPWSTDSMIAFWPGKNVSYPQYFFKSSSGEGMAGYRKRDSHKNTGIFTGSLQESFATGRSCQRL